MRNDVRTAGDARAEMLRSRRWMLVCLDAGEIEEAKRLKAEGDMYARLAEELEQRRAA